MFHCGRAGSLEIRACSCEMPRFKSTMRDRYKSRAARASAPDTLRSTGIGAYRNQFEIMTINFRACSTLNSGDNAQKDLQQNLGLVSKCFHSEQATHLQNLLQIFTMDGPQEQTHLLMPNGGFQKLGLLFLRVPIIWLLMFLQYGYPLVQTQTCSRAAAGIEKLPCNLFGSQFSSVLMQGFSSGPCLRCLLRGFVLSSEG